MPSPRHQQRRFEAVFSQRCLGWWCKRCQEGWGADRGLLVVLMLVLVLVLLLVLVPLLMLLLLLLLM